MEGAPAEFGTAGHWLSRARAEIEQFRMALEARGHEIDPGLEVVCDAASLYPYYDFERCRISIGLPDLSTPSGRYRWLMYLPMLGARTIDAAAAAMDRFLPILATHELAHHLRHRTGRMLRDDPWTEEHVVNSIALSYLRTRPDFEAIAEGIMPILSRARAGLSRMCELDYADATHEDLGAILYHDMKRISPDVYQHAWEKAWERRVPVAQVLEDEHLVTRVELDEAQARQLHAREKYNAQYMRDFATYALLTTTQLQVALVRPDLPTFDDALALYLGPPA
jgi:hypothetical protein